MALGIWSTNIDEILLPMAALAFQQRSHPGIIGPGGTTTPTPLVQFSA
jgi:hypothetical protein